jgi:hypothetical protein
MRGAHARAFETAAFCYIFVAFSALAVYSNFYAEEAVAQWGVLAFELCVRELSDA